MAVAAAVLPLAGLVVTTGVAQAVTTPTATVSQTPGSNAPQFMTSCYAGHQNCAEVRALVQNATTIFAGGKWAEVKDPATGTFSAAHSNLVAFDATTGAVRSGFASHTFNGEVYAIAVSANGSRIYVGGDFTGIDCKKVGSKSVCTTAQHLIAFDASGNPVPAFSVGGVPTVNGGASDPTAVRGRVRSLLLSPDGSTLYVGGDFSHLDGGTASQVGAINVATGALSTAFHPTFASTDNLPEITSLALGPNSLGVPNARLYTAGHFDLVNSTARNTLAAVNPTTGASDTTFNAQISRQTNPYDVHQQGIQVMPLPPADGAAASVLLAQGGHYNRGYRFTLAGKRMWMVQTGGDAQAVATSGNTVYFGGHFICWSTSKPIERADCLTVPMPPGMQHRVGIAAVDLGTGHLVMNWAPLMEPDTTPPYYNDVWSLLMASNGSLYVGGTFREVDFDNPPTRLLGHEKLAVFPAA
jgi:hypothetical protein